MATLRNRFSKQCVLILFLGWFIQLDCQQLKFSVGLRDRGSTSANNFESSKQTPKQFEERKAETLISFNYGVYHPYSKIWEWMDLISKSDTLVDVTQIGVTNEGRPILALATSATENSKKPVVYVEALAHAREWISTAATVFAFGEIFGDVELRELVDWVFVPMVNVDGYAFTWEDEENRFWRKNRRQATKKGCDGVDLNRNWNISWGVKLAASDEPCVENYFGPQPFSEPETRNRAAYIRSNSDRIKSFVTMHSYAQKIVFPYNFDKSLQPDNVELQRSIAKEMAEAMREVNGTEYEFGQAALLIEEASGISTDWTQAVAGIDINLTVELPDTGEFGFALPPDRIIPTGREVLAAMRVLARRVRQLYDEEDLDSS